MLDSALALRGKEGDIVREKFEFSIYNMVKIKLKHANDKNKVFFTGN